MSSRRWGGGGEEEEEAGIGRGFDRSLWPGGRAFELPCCPGSRIFEFLFVPVTTNHFLGWGISVYLTSRFWPGVGNLTAIVGKMSKSRPMNIFWNYRALQVLQGYVERGQWCWRESSAISAMFDLKTFNPISKSQNLL